MELVLKEEQRILQDSAKKLVQQFGGTNTFRDSRKKEPGFDKERLKEIAKAGWLSLMVPERNGGVGLGITELALILEQAGRGLITEPIAALASTARAIGFGHAATGTAETMRSLLSGSQLIVPVIQDPFAIELKREKIFAEHYHYGYQLTGTRNAVPYAKEADFFLVDANTSDGTIIIIVPRETFGVEVESVNTVDGTTHGKVTFSEATIMADDRLVAAVKQGKGLAADLYDRILLGVSAEILGVMEQALDLAVGYLQTREQFGRPIGSFQALQHRAVNDHIQIELLRSLLFQVCSAVDKGNGNRAMVAAVKARASVAVLSVTKSVIQMHGAIGFTDEYDAGLFLRRAMTLSSQYGNSKFHQQRYAHYTRIEEENQNKPVNKRKKRKRKKSIFASP